MRPQHIFYPVLTAISLALCLVPSFARGEETEDTIGLFSAFQETSSSASRAPKPLSQTAENITVITAREIEMLNAHTLGDVLATVPGIQVDLLGGPGSVAFTSIQSSDNFHILVMVDGIPINSLGENFSDVALVPARIIERIEIIKGAASAAWGQALGGVINVITKTPNSRAVSGSLTASIGSKTTTDDNLELSGTKDRFGYYLFGGFLGSDGIVPHISTYARNAYGKLTYELPGGGQAWGTFGYTSANRATIFLPDPSIDLTENQKTNYISASLGLRKQLSSNLELEVGGRHFYRANNIFDTTPSLGTTDTQLARERVTAGTAKLVWRGYNHLLVSGIEYEHGNLDTTSSFQEADSLTPSVDRLAFYLNDTITLGNLTLIPSMRLDHTNVSGNQFSPAIGATYRLGESSVLRVYTARGHSIFSLTQLSNPPQKVWTVQVGIESGIIPFLWQKLNLFRNEVWDIATRDEGLIRRIALGAEYEIRTAPVFNTTLGAGYTFTDTRKTNTDTQVAGLPRHTVQLSLNYDDNTFRGALTGRHIFWNADPSQNARNQGMIWDLHLGATLFKREQNSLELFFSGHNLFNGSQATSEFFPYPGRWFEGGMRVRF